MRYNTNGKKTSKIFLNIKVLFTSLKFFVCVWQRKIFLQKQSVVFVVVCVVVVVVAVENEDKFFPYF
jgi:hypothetical protein